MILDVHVSSRLVAKLYRERDEYVLKNLPEGYLLGVIREEFGPLLDGTDLSLLGVVGGTGIGRISVTPEGIQPGVEMAPLEISHLLKAENTSERFAALVRQYARVAVSGVVPKFIATDTAEPQEPLGKPTLRTGFHIIKGSDDTTPFLGFNKFYTIRVLERLNVVPVAACRS